MNKQNSDVTSPQFVLSFIVKGKGSASMLGKG